MDKNHPFMSQELTYLSQEPAPPTLTHVSIVILTYIYKEAYYKYKEAYYKY